MLRAMSASAMSGPAPRAPLALAAAFAIAALVPALALRGFTVDDALITARYAAHVAAGEGYRLSAGGPVTDGVTPLGFVYLLAPFAGSGPLAAFAAARVIGVAAWTLSAAVLGLAVARVTSPRPRAPAPDPEGALPEAVTSAAPDRRSSRALVLVPLALVATSAPLGAWASSGMETGLVTAIAALAAALPILERPRAAAACAGLAAGLRPELLPWAATLGVGLFLSHRAGPSRADPAPPPDPDDPLVAGPPRPAPAAPRRAWLFLFLSILPFLVASAVRLAVFGRPAPLSIFAKAPDARHGFLYVAACALLAGPTVLLAPIAIARLRGVPRALVASVFVHLGAVALAGGDWMPLSRLVVPVLPSLALAALFVAREAALVATAARLALAVAGHTFVLVHVGPTAAHVGEDRLRVLSELRPALAPARVVASLDIGWVGAATDAAIIDLAGVTDPTIAALPGGHTTKQIPAGLLDARRADTLVLLLAPGERAADPWTRSRFARGVEVWIATTPGIGEDFTPVAESSLPHLRYLVLRKTR